MLHGAHPALLLSQRRRAREKGSYVPVLTQAQRNEMFNQNTSGWETFYKNYPSAPGITEVSRVGFNKSFDQALVYVGTQSHYLAGAGYYVLLVKTNDLTDDARSYLSGHKATLNAIKVIGGVKAVSQAVANEALSLI